MPVRMEGTLLFPATFPVHIVTVDLQIRKLKLRKI
jgi:hypothetical protein